MTDQYSLLIIDDEEFLLRSMEVILTMNGYRVACSTNGMEALQMVKPGQFDLALLDLKLPDIDGLQLLPRLHQIDPDLAVIILTAYISPEIEEETIRCGACDCLLKPITPRVLLKKVAELLATSNYRSENQPS